MKDFLVSAVITIICFVFIAFLTFVVISVQKGENECTGEACQQPTGCPK